MFVDKFSIDFLLYLYVYIYVIVGCIKRFVSLSALIKSFIRRALNRRLRIRIECSCGPLVCPLRQVPSIGRVLKCGRRDVNVCCFAFAFSLSARARIYNT